MLRVVNHQVLSAWLEKRSQDDRRAKEKLATEADVSVSMIEKLKIGRYPVPPKASTRLRLCQACGISEDELFPVVKD